MKQATMNFYPMLVDEETKPTAEEHKALGSILKGFVPDDVRKATGGNVLT